MRQRISVEQLGELTEEQKERLREWWKPREYDVFAVGRISDSVHELEGGLIRTKDCDNDGCHGAELKRESLPLLSIGQCIELLIDLDGIRIKQRTGRTKIYFLNPVNANQEFFDALWQAVKATL